MKKYFFLAGFLLMIGSLQAQRTEQTALHAQAPEKTVLDLSKNKFGWMMHMQYDSLEAVLDDRLMFVHSNGWIETKQEFIQDIKSGKLRYTKIEVLEANARIYSSTAIVNGIGKFNVELDGKPLEITLSYTEVYVLKGTSWVLASRHANRMP
jgi:hypothetical protein